MHFVSKKDAELYDIFSAGERKFLGFTCCIATVNKLASERSVQRVACSHENRGNGAQKPALLVRGSLIPQALASLVWVLTQQAEKTQNSASILASNSLSDAEFILNHDEIITMFFLTFGNLRSK